MVAPSSSGAKRGPVMAPAEGKTLITIRVDDGLLAWFKQPVNDAGGGNYQSLISAALREHIKRKIEPFSARVPAIYAENSSRNSR